MVVNKSLSLTNMLCKCAMGPLRMAKELINKSDPNVKERANFCGRIAKSGKPTKKAKAKKTAETNSNAQKTYIKEKRMHTRELRLSLLVVIASKQQHADSLEISVDSSFP